MTSSRLHGGEIAALVPHAKGSVTSKYIDTVDTALIMAAGAITGHIQSLLDGKEFKQTAYALDHPRKAALARFLRKARVRRDLAQKKSADGNHREWSGWFCAGQHFEVTRNCSVGPVRHVKRKFEPVTHRFIQTALLLYGFLSAPWSCQKAEGFRRLSLHASRVIAHSQWLSRNLVCRRLSRGENRRASYFSENLLKADISVSRW